MRMLCAQEFCNELGKEQYSHGRFTAYLSKYGASKALILYCSAAYIPAIGHLYYLLKAKGFQEPVDESDGDDLTFDKLQPALQHIIKQDPNREANFTAALTVTSGQKFDVAKFPWPEKCVGLVDVDYALVDVGGSTGQLLHEIATAFPDWKPRIMLQDKGKAIEELRSNVNRPHFEYMVHDYFDMQPIKAHAYVFRRIFIDNTDTQCRRILKARKPVFQPKATKLLIIDTTIPEIGAGFIESATDIMAMTLNGAKTRTIKDFTNLLASENFVIKEIWKDGERGQKLLIEAELSD